MEQEKVIGSNFAEFLSAMQIWSGKTQTEMAVGIGCSQPTYSRWIRGSLPVRSFRQKITEVFGLTEDEARALHTGTLLKGLEISPDGTTPVEQLLGAFTVRAENGPPLNEVEVDLIKFLVAHEHEQD